MANQHINSSGRNISRRDSSLSITRSGLPDGGEFVGDVLIAQIPGAVGDDPGTVTPEDAQIIVHTGFETGGGITALVLGSVHQHVDVHPGAGRVMPMLNQLAAIFLQPDACAFQGNYQRRNQDVMPQLAD